MWQVIDFDKWSALIVIEEMLSQNSRAISVTCILIVEIDFSVAHGFDYMTSTSKLPSVSAVYWMKL